MSSLPVVRSRRHLPLVTRAFLAGVIVATAAAAACTTQHPVPAQPDAARSTTFRREQLRGDLAQLEAAVLGRHPFPYGNRDEVAARLRSCYDRLRNGMDAWEFFRILSPAVAAIRCGHTNLSPSPAMLEDAMKHVRLLPQRVIAAAGRLYVLEDFSPAGIPPGSEILRINGKPAVEIITSILENLTADGWNLTGKYQQMNRAFSAMYALYIEDPPSFSVEYVPPGAGSTSTVTVPSWTAERLQASAGAAVTDAAGTSLPYSGSVEGGHAVLRVASFSFYDVARRREFEAFVDGFFDSITAAGARDLVLDLRGNGGGDPYCAAFLFARLVAKESAYFSADTPGYPDLKAIRPAPNGFSGALYVLIDGGCFSTTGHLCSLLRYHGRGTFVGEETAGSFACTDNSTNLTLGATGLRLHLSQTVYATAVDGLPRGRGILPDHEVVPTIAERLAGFDAPMAFARRLAAYGVEGATRGAR